MENDDVEKFLRLPDVLRRVGFKRTTIFKMVKIGAFPSPYRLGPPGTRAVGWKFSEIQAWMVTRVNTRDQPASKNSTC